MKDTKELSIVGWRDCGCGNLLEIFVIDLYNKLVHRMEYKDALREHWSDKPDKKGFIFGDLQDKVREIRHQNKMVPVAEGLEVNGSSYRINAKDVEVGDKKYDLKIIVSENFPTLCEIMREEKVDYCICDISDVKYHEGDYLLDCAKETKTEIVNIDERYPSIGLLKALKERDEA